MDTPDHADPIHICPRCPRQSEQKLTHMIFHQITDWNDAYANGPNIPGGDRWPAA